MGALNANFGLWNASIPPKAKALNEMEDPGTARVARDAFPPLSARSSAVIVQTTFRARY
jgi:hypothetical protein